jgi:ribosome maturation factor RimP
MLVTPTLLLKSKYQHATLIRLKVGLPRFFVLRAWMIPQQEIVDKISSVVIPILRESSLELVDVEFVPSGRRWLLRVYIDKEGGVGISDCEWVSRELSRSLDVEDPIDHPYMLEVSSPGLTRPLKKWQDFERHTGKRCRVLTRETVDGKNELRGTIVRVSAENVELETGESVHEIPLSIIKKANLELEI